MNFLIKNDRFSFVLFGAEHDYRAQLQILEAEILFYKYEICIFYFRFTYNKPYAFVRIAFIEIFISFSR